MRATTTRERLAEFEAAMGGPVRETATVLTDDELRLRARLLVEELAELIAALAGRDEHAAAFTERIWSDVAPMLALRRVPNLLNVAKELADVEYVLHGTAHYCGVDLDEAVAVVHESNMAKASGPVREDGKRMKPAGWQPPDMTRVIRWPAHTGNRHAPYWEPGL